jgi:hypothetical protein
MSNLFVDEFGIRKWFLNGCLHRVDGPAIEFPNGSSIWCINGVPHREDGPAVKLVDGSEKWYLNGKLLTKESWLEKIPEESKMETLFNSKFILGE